MGAGLLAHPGALFAQGSDAETTATPDGETIVITGTRSARDLTSEPYSISVISAQRLERELPRTVPEALSQIPGVLVQKTASGHGSPYIRGFTGNRTLLVIDGIRYNNATFRDGANEYFAQIDPFTLAQVEVISGPSSALYGSEAVGGVINLSTRQSRLSESTGRFAGVEQVLRVSSGDGSVVSRSAFDIGNGGQWGLRAGATLRDYDDIRAADFGRLPNTGYSERAIDARLDLSLSPDWTATISHQSLWQDDVPRTHSTIFSVPFAGTEAGTDLVRDKDHRRGLTYLKLRGTPGADWMQGVELTLSHQSRREWEDRVRSDRTAIDQMFDSDLTALNAVATTELSGLNLTYGIDLSRERVDSARSDFDANGDLLRIRLQGQVGTDARYDQAGLFLRVIAPLSDVWRVEGGLRGSIVDLSIGKFADPVTDQAIAFDNNWSNLSGSLRLRYNLGEHTVWGAYSRSFRAPNIADVSRFGRSRSSEIEVASVDLMPEEFDTFEIGYRLTARGFSIGLTGYTTELSNFIATVPTGRIRDGLTEVAKRNAGSGRISGVEASMEARLGNGFTLSGNATWLRGRITNPTASGPVREPISRIQPLTGNLALGWEAESSWARIELSLVDRADELSAGDLLDVERIPPGGTPGYTLLNIRAGTQVSRSASINLSLVNLLDEAYRAHGSGNNEPGRHLTFGLAMQF